MDWKECWGCGSYEAASGWILADFGIGQTAVKERGCMHMEAQRSCPDSRESAAGGLQQGARGELKDRARPLADSNLHSRVGLAVREIFGSGGNWLAGERSCDAVAVAVQQYVLVEGSWSRGAKWYKEMRASIGSVAAHITPEVSEVAVLGHTDHGSDWGQSESVKKGDNRRGAGRRQEPAWNRPNSRFSLLFRNRDATDKYRGVQITQLDSWRAAECAETLNRVGVTRNNAQKHEQWGFEGSRAVLMRRFKHVRHAAQRVADVY
ncbi:hypothetical protein GGX14DRAFT_400706 [Mycena pura]|uniref:Uncharacterized protein n=1 Tax=Mycena pura TaxID=153505 RepID=A0AAD6V1A4_9AGAR|nr:hypothetical protein GGX14DRAFT_400706 [Mycena pura]